MSDLNDSKVRLNFNIPSVSIFVIYLEATLSLTHAGDVEVTEHPLEDGSSIADGARAKQTTLQMEAVVTDFPFTPTVYGEQPAGPGRAREVYAALVQVKNQSGVVRVTTPLAVYENMVVKQLSAPQLANLGTSVKFTIQLTQVKFVRSQTVALKRVKTTKAQEKQKDGAKSATPTPAPVQHKTILQHAATLTTKPFFGGG